MREAKRPEQVKLIMGMIARDQALFQKLEKILGKRFGSIDCRSEVMSFGHTSHYEQEMGEGLKRQFLGFSRLIRQDDLSKIKCFTNKLEKKFSLFPDRPSRQINLDPGYLSPAKLVLATIKDYNHRIYIGKNIYAEITLHFRGSSFEAWEWTYADYKTKECIEFFNKVRRGHLKQIYP